MARAKPHAIVGKGAPPVQSDTSGKRLHPGLNDRARFMTKALAIEFTKREQVLSGADTFAVAMTASAEMKWSNGWSAAATFEGEFSDVTRSYAGKGVVRYAW